MTSLEEFRLQKEELTARFDQLNETLKVNAIDFAVVPLFPCRFDRPPIGPFGFRATARKRRSKCRASWNAWNVRRC